MKSLYDFSSADQYREYLRTYFAGLAMQGLIAGHDMYTVLSPEAKASLSVQCADALLVELNKKEG